MFSVKKISILIGILFLSISCSNNNVSQEAINTINKININPIGLSYNIKISYTDSTVTKAILIAQEHRDYSNLSLKYSEFPEGLEITFFDEKGNANYITADYGVLYNDTKLLSLNSNVKLETHDGSILKTDQLYWDAKTEWIFTDNPFTFKDSLYNVSGVKLDANKAFSILRTGGIEGTIIAQEQ